MFNNCWRCGGANVSGLLVCAECLEDYNLVAQEPPKDEFRTQLNRVRGKCFMTFVSIDNSFIRHELSLSVYNVMVGWCKANMTYNGNGVYVSTFAKQEKARKIMLDHAAFPF